MTDHYAWRLTAAANGGERAPISELHAAQQQVRELLRLPGEKTVEAE